MQNQSNRTCPGCGAAVTLRDKRKKYCNRLCYHGGEYREDYLRRMMENATPDKCIEWPYSRNDKNYGTVRFEGIVHSVHRLSYILFVGPLAGEECALHSCDNPPCFNYHHLFKGDRSDNSDDMISKGRAVHKAVPALCKLDGDQVRAIRERWAAHSNSGDLAVEFGVSRQQIYRIATGKNRSSVDDFTSQYQAKPRKILTEAQRNEIKARYVPYSNTSELAKEYGITKTRVKQLGREARLALGL